MSAYIQRIAERLNEGLRLRNAKNVFQLSKVLSHELQSLDPNDFDPEVQADFAQLRHEIKVLSEQRQLSKMDNGAISVSLLISTLKQYRGQGSGGTSRSFAFIHDAALRTIIERDYNELHVILFPSTAWKSTVIMAGSILEAILYDRLANRPAGAATAVSSSKAPSGHVDKWTLEQMIVVAADIGSLPPARAETIDRVLRNYRNFVHPRREIKEEHSCGEPEATMAKGALDAVCEFCEANP